MKEKLPAYIYIAIKYTLGKAPYIGSHSKLLVFISLALCLLVLPIIAVLLTLIFVYQQAIDSFLTWREGERYCGLLHGIDAICCNQDRCIPSFYMLIDYAKSHETLREELIRFLQRCRYERHKKLFYSWSSFMGYHYYYRNLLGAADLVTLAADNGVVVRSKAQFADVIAQYDVAPMPDADAGLLQIVVYPNSVQLPDADGGGNQNVKLVCVRIHHALGDGKAILGWIMADLCEKLDTTVNGTGNGCVPNGACYTDDDCSDDTPLAMIDDAINSVCRTLLEDRLKILPSDYNDDNILSGKCLREEKYLCWFSDQSSEYMEKIRTIRHSRPGVTFLDVANTCIASSLQDYYQKYADSIPAVIGGGVVLSPAYYSFRYGDTNYKLSNEFSAGGFWFPVRLTNAAPHTHTEILAKLQFCQREYQMIKECIDVKFNYWLCDLFAMVPYPVARCLANQTRVTIGVSSLPGPDRAMTVFGGAHVRDVICMPPNSPGTALHFVICSYDKQLRIALTIDKSVVGDFDQAQSIVDGIIKYLDILYDAIKDE